MRYALLSYIYFNGTDPKYKFRCILITCAPSFFSVVPDGSPPVHPVHGRACSKLPRPAQSARRSFPPLTTRPKPFCACPEPDYGSSSLWGRISSGRARTASTSTFLCPKQVGNTDLFLLQMRVVRAEQNIQPWPERPWIRKDNCFLGFG